MKISAMKDAADGDSNADDEAELIGLAWIT